MLKVTIQLSVPTWTVEGENVREGTEHLVKRLEFQCENDVANGIFKAVCDTAEREKTNEDEEAKIGGTS